MPFIQRWNKTKLEKKNNKNSLLINPFPLFFLFYPSLFSLRWHIPYRKYCIICIEDLNSFHCCHIIGLWFLVFFSLLICFSIYCVSFFSQTHSSIVGLFDFRAIIVLAAVVIWWRISVFIDFIDPGIIDDTAIFTFGCISVPDIFWYISNILWKDYFCICNYRFWSL